ncbi:glycosyltransferase [Synechococcus sp. RSCCF101]|uniref:glycosyltransferase n=1 Tax=Synechococcus sp. RSCCF101 TaxID=2511069 RepID=UPI0012463DBD|nr:glycosyltransferase [Synechococcus sp. RSCCF101]QEY31792.1 glycosyltransferase [Synechococcus sp. RSCCF101]
MAWLELTLRVPSSSAISHLFRLSLPGTSESVLIRASNHWPTSTVYFDADGSSAEPAGVAPGLTCLSDPELTASLECRSISPMRAYLGISRQLCADDPATLYTSPAELRGDLEHLPLPERLALLQPIYARHLRERQAPLASADWLELKPLLESATEPPAPEALGPLERQVQQLWRQLATCPAPSEPGERVSIVIPSYGNWQQTLQCLWSLLLDAATASGPALELILMDDCSPEPPPEVFQALEAEPHRHQLRLLRNASNLGYLRSCNAGAARASGAWIVLLNNDTLVCSGWLPPLLATFRRFPAAGLVGPQLLYPNGRLQEAGGIVWADGSAWNYGRDGERNDPAYRFLREVDYISGACLMISRAVLERSGGFDPRYAPAYYEDTDLAMQVRALGLRVYVQPLSQVIHCEGASSGRDPQSGVKRYQLRNQQLFRGKWSSVLEQHQANATKVLQASNRCVGRILILEVTLPTPDQDAGSLYIHNLMVDLRALGYHLTYVPVDNLLDRPDYGDPLRAMGVEVIHHPWISNVEAYLQEQAASFDAVLLCRPQVAERCLDLLREAAPYVPLLYYSHDLHGLRMERQRQLAPDQVSELELQRMDALERRILHAVDVAVLLSEAERQAAEERLQPSCVLAVLPPRVSATRSTVPFAERSDVVFVGGFGHPPNLDAVRFYIEAVMPRLRERGCCPRLHVVGSKPPPELLTLEGEDVVVHGYVADLEALLSRMRLAVLPLRYGAGVKGKVLLAMACGLPMVLTPVAAEGLGLRDGVQARIAADAEAFAAAVQHSYQHDDIWQGLADAAQTHLERGWGQVACQESLRELLQQVHLPARSPADPTPEDGWAPATGAGEEELLAFYTLPG